LNSIRRATIQTKEITRKEPIWIGKTNKTKRLLERELVFYLRSYGLIRERETRDYETRYHHNFQSSGVWAIKLFTKSCLYFQSSLYVCTHIWVLLGYKTCRKCNFISYFVKIWKAKLSQDDFKNLNKQCFNDSSFSRLKINHVIDNT